MINKQEFFIHACKNGYIDVCKQMYTENKINVSSNNECAFYHASFNGHLQVCKWLLTIKPDINMNVFNEKSLYNACKNDYIELCIWIFTHKNANFDHNHLFYTACKVGYLKLCKLLYEINSDVNFNDAFSTSCVNEHLNISKWLYEIKPDIDICINNHSAFRYACYYSIVDMAKWLESISQNKYKIIDYHPDSIKYIIQMSFGKTREISNVEQCSICQDIKSNIITDCNHQYCYDCIVSWLNINNSCPYCRHKLNNLSCSRINTKMS